MKVGVILLIAIPLRQSKFHKYWLLNCDDRKFPESVLLNIRHVSKLERVDKDKVPAIYTTTLICKKCVTTTTSVKEKHLIKMRDTRP